MTREDWIWVAIRIFGVYLLVLAIVSIPEIVNSGMMTRSFWHMRQRHESRLSYRVSPSDVAKQLESEGKTIPEDKLVSALAQFEAQGRAAGDMSSTLFASSLSSLVTDCFKFLLFTVCGLYFLRSGRVFFRLISKRDNEPHGESVQNKAPEATR